MYYVVFVGEEVVGFFDVYCEDFCDVVFLLGDF